MRFLILNITFAAILIAGWMHGFVKDVAAMDSTGFIYLIAAVFLVGLWDAFKGDWRGVGFAGILLPVLGVMGTVVGIIMVLQAGGEFADKLPGIGMALATTAVGLSGYAWMVVNQWICE